jgi:hypothetical protein
MSFKGVLKMEKVRMVRGTQGNRTIATITKQAEMKQAQLKQDVKVWQHDWFYIDDEAPLTVSDVLMSIGFYIMLPLMVLAVIGYMAFYF